MVIYRDEEDDCELKIAEPGRVAPVRADTARLFISLDLCMVEPDV